MVKAAFVTGIPFKYAVIDDFFRADDALKFHYAFPSFSRLDQVKARILSGRVYGPPPAHTGSPLDRAFSALASKSFTRSLSEISGIEHLAMDETNDGAGVHVGLTGSQLPIHADHNTHPKAPWLYRRLNLMVYLNRDWNPSWRANLLIYDETGSRRLLEIEPRFNRAVLMEVHDNAFHGYDILDLPAGQTRQSIAAYFYSLERSPKQIAEPHGTIFADSTDLRRRTKGALVRRLNALAIKPRWL